MKSRKELKRQSTSDISAGKPQGRILQTPNIGMGKDPENIIDRTAPASFEEQASLLSGARSDEERARLAMHLQQTRGNAYVRRLVQSPVVQAKLTVNPPDDVYEREADRVAETVQRQEIPEDEELLQAKAVTELQRQSEEEEEEEELQAKAVAGLQRQEIPEEEELLQAKAVTDLQRQEEEEELLQPKASGEDSLVVGDDLEIRIEGARGGGASLDGGVQGTLENHLGHDFSEVRIHTDSRSDRLSRELGAEAFTTGRDIFFRDGNYQPSSDAGKGLLAHELTHVVQQQAAPAIQRQSTTEEEIENSAASPDTAAATQRGFDAATAASLRHQIMTPIEQAVEEGLQATPPDIRRAIELISDAVIAVSETNFEAGGFDEAAAAQMRHVILTPLEQAGEILSASLNAPERAMELLSKAIVETSTLRLEASAG